MTRIVSADTLRRIAGGKPPISNVNSIVVGLNTYGAKFGVEKPHRLAQFLCQIAHESTRFKYDREIWGPTKAQRGYEGRKDLGNTRKGDGSKFRGYTPMQITGRHNTTSFYNWCCATFPDVDVPNFVEHPHFMNTDPWEGLGPIWYWAVGNPTGKSLNRYADDGNVEVITRRINGGLNGYDDRLELLERASLVLLGYALTKGAVSRFQTDRGLAADGVVGKKTRAAMHAALVELSIFGERFVVDDPGPNHDDQFDPPPPETKAKPIAEQPAPEGGFSFGQVLKWGALAALLGGGLLFALS